MGSKARESRDKLINEYVGFVEKVARQLARQMNLSSVKLEDYISAGMMGLIQAASRYEEGNSANFKTYAYYRIRGAIIDDLRRSSELSARSYRHAKALGAANEMRKVQLEEHEQKLKKKKKEPWGFSMAQVLEHAAQGALAYRIAVEMTETVAEDSDSTPEAILLKQQRNEELREIISELPELERKIIEDYYFKELSFAEIAERHDGISRSWVSRLHNRAIRKIRKRCHGKDVLP